MGIITYILIGLIVGTIAKLIMPGPDHWGWLSTLLLGLSGAILAGYIGRMLGWYHEGHAAGFLGSIVGAIAVLAGYRFLKNIKR